MQTFEILTAVFALLASILLVAAPHRRRWIRVACALVATALLVQLAWEGSHWQVWPLYLACLLALLCGLWGAGLSRPLRWIAASAGVLLIAIAFVLSWAFPMFRLPTPTGPFAVGTRIFPLIDRSRNETAGTSPSGKRELIIQAWYPAEPPQGIAGLWPGRRAAYQRVGELTRRASYRSVLKTNSFQDALVKSGGPYPVVLYNPAWQGERTEGTFQAEELASHGFVVVAIDHTFFGGLVQFPDGRVADSRNAPELGSFENSTMPEQAALGARYVHLEAEDDVFVLNQLQAMNEDPTSPFFHRLDMQRVGAMGYSVGGAVAEEAAFADSRIRSALDLDGWSFGELQHRGLAKPLMVIYESRANTIPTEDELHSGPKAQQLYWQFSAQDFVHVTESLREYGGWLLFVSGTNHVDFSDRSLFSPLRKWTGGGTLDPRRAHAVMNAYTLAFFEQTLNGTKEPLLDQSSSAYPEVDFQHFPAKQPAR